MGIAAGLARAGSLVRPGLVFALVAFAFILADAFDGSPIYADTDDLVRLLQIRDLIGDRAYSDLTLPFIAMPEPYVSHYSRVVDLPYFLIGSALAPLLGVDMALAAVAWMVPPLLACIFCAFAVAVLRRVAGGRFGMPEAAIAAVAMAPALLEFTPQRVDHHNLQLVAMMAMLAGLTGPGRKSGVLAGVAISLSVSIGLECLPFILAGLAGLVLAGALGGRADKARMQAAGLALAAASVPAAMLGYGPAIVSAGNCDTVSLPWLGAFAGGGLVLCLVPPLWRLPIFAGNRGAAAAARLASLGAPVLALAAGIAVAFPECAGGGYYGVVDPLSRRLWLDTLSQERGILRQFAEGRLPLAIFCVLWGFLLIATAPFAWRGWREGRRALALTWLVALSGLATFLLVERSARVDAALVAMLVPAAMGLLRGGQTSGGARGWLAPALAVPLVVTLGTYLAVPKAPPAFTVLDQLHFDRCAAFDADMLDTIPPSRILAPLGAAARIVEHDRRHSVSALPLHRAASGMHRMFAAFTTHDAAERAAALAPFDYLAVCLRDLGFPGGQELPLFGALLRGEPVAGLSPVGTGHSSPFRLYRIDTAATR